MADPIRVGPGVVVPASALSVAFARSSGPGGQNVNKVASKVQLRFDVAAVRGLDEPARERLRALAGARLDAAGRTVVVTSQRTRDQHRNLEDAREKVRDLVARAMRRPKARRATRPSKGAEERRLAAKKLDARRKQARGRVRGED